MHQDRIMRYLIFAFLCLSGSVLACDAEFKESNEPFALKTDKADATYSFKLFFPVRESSSNKYYMSALLMSIDGKKAHELDYVKSETFPLFYESAVEVADAGFLEAKLIAQYNHLDEGGAAGFSLCMPTETYLLQYLLENGGRMHNKTIMKDTAQKRRSTSY